MLFNREAGCKRVNGNGISKQNGQDSQHFPLYVCVSILPRSHPPSFMSQDWLTKFGYLPPPDPITGGADQSHHGHAALRGAGGNGGSRSGGGTGVGGMGMEERGWELP